MIDLSHLFGSILKPPIRNYGAAKKEAKQLTFVPPFFLEQGKPVAGIPMHLVAHTRGPDWSVVKIVVPNHELP
jgi:hypothetical protein